MHQRSQSESNLRIKYEDIASRIQRLRESPVSYQSKNIQSDKYASQHHSKVLKTITYRGQRTSTEESLPESKKFTENMLKPSRTTGIKKLYQPQMKESFGTENEKLNPTKSSKIIKENQKPNIRNESKIEHTKYINSPEDSKTTPWLDSGKRENFEEMTRISRAGKILKIGKIYSLSSLGPVIV